MATPDRRSWGFTTSISAQLVNSAWLDNPPFSLKKRVGSSSISFLKGCPFQPDPFHLCGQIVFDQLEDISGTQGHNIGGFLLPTPFLVEIRTSGHGRNCVSSKSNLNHLHGRLGQGSCSSNKWLVMNIGNYLEVPTWSLSHPPPQIKTARPPPLWPILASLAVPPQLRGSALLRRKPERALNRSVSRPFRLSAGAEKLQQLKDRSQAEAPLCDDPRSAEHHRVGMRGGGLERGCVVFGVRVGMVAIQVKSRRNYVDS